MNKKMKIIFKIFILFILFFPIVLYSTNSIHDPFLNNHIASMELNFNTPHLQDSSISFSNLKGFGVLIITLGKISGLRPHDLQFLPITGVLFILAIYILSNQILKDQLIASFITIIVIYKFGVMNYSIWPHSFGYVFYLLAAFIYIKMMYGVNKIPLLLILFILYLSIHFMSYTTEWWIVSFSTLIYLVSISIKPDGINKNSLKHYTLCVIICFMGFNKLIYEKLPSLNMENFIDSANVFLFRHGTIFHELQHISGKDYLYQRVVTPIIPCIDLIFIMLILSIVLIYFFKLIILLVSRCSLKTIDWIWIVLFLVSISDLIVYGIIGVIPLRYFLLIYPILSVFAMQRLCQKKLINRSYLAILIILVISSFSLNWISGDLMKSSSKFEEIEPSANWYFEKVTEFDRPLTDHFTGGRFQIVAVSNGFDFSQTFYTSNLYCSLVDTNCTNEEQFSGMYIIINKMHSNKRTWSGGWEDFEELKPHIQNIENNININKIFDDSVVWIFRGIN